jgi:hypothetical protein
MAETKEEIPMLAPVTVNDFRATLGALLSLDESEGVSFHIFSFPEDLCVRLFMKNINKRVLEAEIRGELVAMHVSMQAVMLFHSKRRDLNPKKGSFLTPHFIMLAVGGRDVGEVRSLTDLIGLRVKVETYDAPKGRSSANAARASDTECICRYVPGCLTCGDANPSCVSLQNSS